MTQLGLPVPTRLRLGFQDARRALAALVPSRVVGADSALSLEASRSFEEPPRTIASRVIEDVKLRAHRVEGATEVRIAAFLDGTQSSRVLTYDEGVPLVFAITAAVVRIRRDRRMTTWNVPLVQGKLYAPCNRLGGALLDSLLAAGIEVHDTSDSTQEAGDDSPHPYVLVQRALVSVRSDREALERSLAEEWCAREREPLYIDGGLHRSDRVARSPLAVGVAKSHHTIYAEGAALRAVLALRAGERSSVFAVTSRARAEVASWYLRLREPEGADPLFGLVRIEVSHADVAGTLGERADEVSRWVMAERSPIALPDGRWDRMAYGIRDCEEYLRAVAR